MAREKCAVFIPIGFRRVNHFVKKTNWSHTKWRPATTRVYITCIYRSICIFFFFFLSFGWHAGRRQISCHRPLCRLPIRINQKWIEIDKTSTCTTVTFFKTIAGHTRADFMIDSVLEGSSPPKSPTDPIFCRPLIDKSGSYKKYICSIENGLSLIFLINYYCFT